MSAALGWFAGAALAVVLAVAAVGKLRDLEGFRGTLDRQVLFPEWSLRPLSIAVPSAELAVRSCS